MSTVGAGDIIMSTALICLCVLGIGLVLMLSMGLAADRIIAAIKELEKEGK